MKNDIPPGATAQDWAHFATTLGLESDLLPTVVNAAAKRSPHSKVEDFSKVPSDYNAQGLARGIADWPSHVATARDIARWSKVPDLGICLISRSVRALDIDVNDAAIAHAIREYIERVAGTLPRRTRSNSGRMVLAFRMSGEHPKRAFALKGRPADKVEFLGTGNQFVIAGQHKSGARLEWHGGLPAEIPELLAEEFESLWAELLEQFAEPGSATSARARGEAVKHEPRADASAFRNWLFENHECGDEAADGELEVLCPNDASHSDGGAQWAGYNEAKGFHCFHAGCSHLGLFDFQAAIGYTAATVLEEFEDLTTPEAVAALELAEQVSAKARAARFTPSPWHEFSSGPAPTWIVRGILPQAGLAVVYGEPGSGKTFFALDLVAAVARGVEWRGRRVKQGRVVYIAAEGVGGFRNRVNAYAKAHGIDGRDLEPSAMQLAIIDETPDLLGNDHKALADAIGRAAVVVVDTLAQTTAGGTENSGEDMGKALAHCKAIHSATGALVILIHHSGKDAARGARGWSGIKGACDAEIEITTAGSGVHSAKVTKQKDGEAGQVLPFKLLPTLLGIDEDGEPIDSCVVAACDAPPAKRAEPKGENQRAVLAVARQAMDTAAHVPLESLIVQAIAVLGGEPERRREVARRAIKDLVANEYLTQQADEIALP